MADSPSKLKAPVLLVVICGWLIPGSGYWLIGQKSRALATGITVIAIYLAGLLIGGVRVVEVPGFDEHGEKIQLTLKGPAPTMWIMKAAPTQEIKAKPWSIAQILAGPMGIASGAASIWAAEPVYTTADDGTTLSRPRAAVTHTPVNEAGTLYTAVAGMLNLLAIIDAGHRAFHGEEE